MRNRYEDRRRFEPGYGRPPVQGRYHPERYGPEFDRDDEFEDSRREWDPEGYSEQSTAGADDTWTAGRGRYADQDVGREESSRRGFSGGGGYGGGYRPYRGGGSREEFPGWGPGGPSSREFHRGEHPPWQRESWWRDQPQRSTGRYAGRGPKGYTRSDDRIREEISDRLMAAPDIDASDIEIDVKNGEVVLRGFVDSRETKRLSEDLAESVQGVGEVQNQLRIRTIDTQFGGNGESRPSRRDEARSK